MFLSMTRQEAMRFLQENMYESVNEIAQNDIENIA